MGIGEILAKGCKLALRRYISSGDLMHSIVIIVKPCCTPYFKVAKRLDFKLKKNK